MSFLIPIPAPLGHPDTSPSAGRVGGGSSPKDSVPAGELQGGGVGFLGAFLQALGQPAVQASEEEGGLEQGEVGTPIGEQSEGGPDHPGAHASGPSHGGWPGEASDPGQRAWLEGASARLAVRDAGAGLDGTRSAAATEAEGKAVEAPNPAPRLRNVEGVHPELVGRVERVVDRMWSEYGDRVEVVEGHRTQARQEALFAQGRTAPGPKVTWTRHSAHSRGEAVDVRINGGWDDLDAFRRLQSVAREEGIRTLGMKDPGHLELPRGAGEGRGGPASRGEPHPLHHRSGEPAEPIRPVAAGASGIARVAPVARVAQVARPGVARITPAPDSSGGTGRAEAVRSHGGTAWPTTALQGGASSTHGLPGTPVGSASTSAHEQTEGGHGESGTGTGNGGAERLSQSASGNGDSPSFRSLMPPEGIGIRTGGVVGEVSGTTGPSTHLRAENVRALQAAAGPSGRLDVALNNVDGNGTDIHLQMRGRGVAAQIDVQDQAQARSLRMRMGELRTSLAERGLEADRLGVKWMPVETGPVREGLRGDGSPPREDGGHESRRDGDPGGQERRGSRREEPGDGDFSRHFQRRRDDH